MPDRGFMQIQAEIGAASAIKRICSPEGGLFPNRVESIRFRSASMGSNHPSVVLLAFWYWNPNPLCPHCIIPLFVLIPASFGWF